MSTSGETLWSSVYGYHSSRVENEKLNFIENVMSVALLSDRQRSKKKRRMDVMKIRDLHFIRSSSHDNNQS